MEVEEEPSVSFASSSIVVAMVYLKVLMELSFQKPFTKWSMATGSSAKNNKLLKHQLSNSHRQAVSQAEMCNEVERRGSVFTQLQCSSNAGKSANLLMLSKYVKGAYWLMKNEVAYTTRYESLIELCTDLDESNHLANWQKIRQKNATYKSLATSLEMLHASL